MGFAALLPMLMPLVQNLLKPKGSGSASDVPLMEIITAFLEKLKASQVAQAKDPFSEMLERFEQVVPAGKEKEAINAITMGLQARQEWRKVVGPRMVETTNFSKER